jgi:hypothetical protein
MNTNIEIQASNEWHLLKGDSQFGPYTYSEMIKMMQEKMVFGFDYVWAPHMESWTAVSDVPEFSEDRLTRLAEKMSGAQNDLFNRRNSERILCKLPVLVHDNQNMWHGSAENLSEGGALLLIENPLFLPGHIIHLHFRTQTNLVSFNCTAEVLSKRLVKQRVQHDTRIHYAVKFLHLGQFGRDQIKTQIQNFKQAKGA